MMKIEDRPVQKFEFAIETPNYFNNQTFELQLEDNEDFEKSVVNFVADTEDKPEEESEVFFRDPEYVTLLIETPEYQDNKMVSVKLEDLIMSEADLEGVEVEYVEDIDSSYDYEFPISSDLSEDEAARLKA